MSSELGAVRIESSPVAGNAPFESPFAPSAVSTFTTNFVVVTVDEGYVRIAHITLKNKDEELVNPTAPRSLYR
jgi:hypothetical protein